MSAEENLEQPEGEILQEWGPDEEPPVDAEATREEEDRAEQGEESDEEHFVQPEASEEEGEAEGSEQEEQSGDEEEPEADCKYYILDAEAGSAHFQKHNPNTALQRNC